MKKLLCPLLILFVFSCSSDDESKLSKEELALKTQNEMYREVMSNIQGHWKGFQHYNAPSDKRPTGWEDISNIKWTQEYIFNSNGTCKSIYSSDYSDAGTYSIVKNEDYIREPSIKCELFLIITYNNNGKNDIVRKTSIWMDGEYLRLSTDSHGTKIHESSGIGGELAIRYKKK